MHELRRTGTASNIPAFVGLKLSKFRLLDHWALENNKEVLEEKKRKRKKAKKKRSSKYYGWGYIGYGSPGMYDGIGDAGGAGDGGGGGE